MAVVTEITTPVAWWKEPTREQWHAWIAAWLGWVLDAFDFTIFLLIMAPIAQDFNVPLVEVTAVFTITLWMQPAGGAQLGGALWVDENQDAKLFGLGPERTKFRIRQLLAIDAAADQRARQSKLLDRMFELLGSEVRVL